MSRFCARVGLQNQHLLIADLQNWQRCGPSSIDLCIFASSHSVFQFYLPLSPNNNVPCPNYYPRSVRGLICSALLTWEQRWSDCFVCFVWVSFCGLGMEMHSSRFRESLYCYRVLFKSVQENADLIFSFVSVVKFSEIVASINWEIIFCIHDGLLKIHFHFIICTLVHM